MTSRFRGFLMLYLFLGAVLLIGGATAYSGWRSARIAEAHPPAGRFVTVDGVRVHYVDRGPDDGQAVLLLHGASGNLNDQMMALGDRLGSLRVVALDRPGHGWSERGGDAMALPSTQADLVAEVMDALDLGRVVVVGHSWSGSLALNLALDHGERVAGLVLLAPASHPWPGGLAWYNNLAGVPLIGEIFVRALVLPIGERLIGAATEGVFAPQEPPENYADRVGTELALRPASFRANALDIGRLKPFLAEQSRRYGEIAVPTTVITGTADEVVSPAIHSRPLVRQIPGATLIELEGVGHMPHHAEPDLIAAEIGRIAADAAPASDTD